jgi:cytidyltransferase-like protein
MSICNLDHFAESYWDPRRHVLVGGAFDPLHEGHLAYFEEARKLGPLVCAVSPDRTVAAKGKIPCLPEATRLKVLNACSLVEHVILAADKAAVIRALKPKAYVIGSDWLTAFPDEEKQACLDVTTRVVFASCRENSSTALLADYERRRNARKLYAFEQFIQQQQPAAKPWEPVIDYSWEARKVVEGPHAQLIKDAFAPRHALDAGCGRHGILVRMLRNLGVDAVGFDAQAECVEDQKYRWRYMLYEDDLLTAEREESGEPCDLVICREVLEHLTVRQLAVAVRNLVTLSSKYVYVTTRFTTGPHLLDVDGSDSLDPTHISMLNQDLLRTLFVLEGCTRRADLEQKLDWMKKSRVLVYQVP